MTLNGTEDANPFNLFTRRIPEVVVPKKNVKFFNKVFDNFFADSRKKSLRSAIFSRDGD